MTPSLIGVAARIITGAEQLDPLLHWQVREVMVRSDPAQTLQIDGEAAGVVSVKAEILPRQRRCCGAGLRDGIALAAGDKPPPYATSPAPNYTTG